MDAAGNLTDDQINEHLRALRASVDRCFDDGVAWLSVQGVSALLHPRDIEPASVEDPRIQAALRDWAERGFIEFRGEPEAYLRVLKPFYPEE